MTVGRCFAALLSGACAWLAADTMVAIWVKREPGWWATITGIAFGGIAAMLWRMSQ